MKDYKDLFYIKDGVLHSREELNPESELEALLMSVAAWRMRVENPGVMSDVTGTCGLCALDILCSKCALPGCTDYGSPFMNYCDNPTSENAQAMVDELISLCPDWVRGLLGEGVEEDEGKEERYCEPWKASHLYDVVLDNDDEEVVVVALDSSRDAEEAYRDRIIACVNACQGISNKELGEGLKSGPTVAEVCELLKEIEDNGISYPMIAFHKDESGRLMIGDNEDEKFDFGDAATMMQRLAEYVENINYRQL